VGLLFSENVAYVAKAVMRLLEKLDTASNALVAVAALLALAYAHVQISEARRAERQSEAHELWREVVRLGFDNPQLSDPTRKLAEFDHTNLTVNGNKDSYQKYELFVDTLLSASEGIMEVLPNPQWEATIRNELKQHRDFLLSEHFVKTSGFHEEFTPKFQEFVRDALAGDR
jgi:hypothetical protein